MSPDAGVVSPIIPVTPHSLDWLTPYEGRIQDAGRKTARPYQAQRPLIQIAMISPRPVTLDWLTPESTISVTHDAIDIYALDWLTPLLMIHQISMCVLINLWTG